MIELAWFTFDPYATTLAQYKIQDKPALAQCVR